MNLSSLTSADLKRIGKLIVRKAALVARVQKVDRQLAAYESGKPASAPARVGRRRKRRKLKATIIEVLQKAGKEGVTVRGIAEKVGVDPNRIYNWFYGTGSNKNPLNKIGQGTYRWEG